MRFIASQAWRSSRSTAKFSTQNTTSRRVHVVQSCTRARADSRSHPVATLAAEHVRRRLSMHDVSMRGHFVRMAARTDDTIPQRLLASTFMACLHVRLYGLCVTLGTMTYYIATDAAE